MQWFSDITGFLFDKERSLSRKAALTVLIAITIYFTDDVIGFSYYYNTERKIEEVASISKILKESTLDSTLTSELSVFRSHIIHRRSGKVWLEDWVLSFFKGKDSRKQIPVLKSKNHNDTVREVYPKNDLWFLLSASGITLFVGLFTTIAMFFVGNNSPLIKFSTAAVTFIITMALSGIWYWLFDFITKICNGPINGIWTINYIINWIIQFAIGIMSYFSLIRFNKRQLRNIQ